MVGEPANPSDRSGGRALDPVTRERLVALLDRELARVCRDALADGVSAGELSARLDARIALLRARIADGCRGSVTTGQRREP